MPLGFTQGAQLGIGGREPAFSLTGKVVLLGGGLGEPFGATECVWPDMSCRELGPLVRFMGLRFGVVLGLSPCWSLDHAGPCYAHMLTDSFSGPLFLFLFSGLSIELIVKYYI